MEYLVYRNGGGHGGRKLGHPLIYHAACTICQRSAVKGYVRTKYIFFTQGWLNVPLHNSDQNLCCLIGVYYFITAYLSEVMFIYS